MLGDELNVPKRLDLSRSSFMDDELDSKHLLQKLQEKDKIIRKLIIKVNKLESALSKYSKEVEKGVHSGEGATQHCYDFQLIRAEFKKNKQLEGLVMGTCARLKELNQACLVNQLYVNNPEQPKKREPLSIRSLPVSSNSEINQQFEQIIPLQNEIRQQLQLIKKTIQFYQRQAPAITKESLSSNIIPIQKPLVKDEKLLELQEEVKSLKLQCEEQKRRCKKLKGLLETSQSENNSQINRIDKMAPKQLNLKEKSREQLLKEITELKYRIKCLEEQKSQILKQSLKEKGQWSKKYKVFLKFIRSIKDKIVIDEQALFA